MYQGVSRILRGCKTSYKGFLKAFLQKSERPLVYKILNRREEDLKSRMESHLPTENESVTKNRQENPISKNEERKAEKNASRKEYLGNSKAPWKF